MVVLIYLLRRKANTPIANGKFKTIIREGKLVNDKQSLLRLFIQLVYF